ncbi:MAG: translation initiation factor IF-2 [Minisyncoccales bacterium]
MEEKGKIRQPIVTIAGHVDHGKTTILDKLRESSVAEGEAGKITQKISFTNFPSENIKRSCHLLDKHGLKLEIPGFLFIDTPGHQAFTNLRKRGGSLADLAVLVIDINEGIMPQTQEVLRILKENKTPFIIALNKIDKISGWRKQDEDIKRDIEKQAIRTRQEFDEKIYKLIAALQHWKFDADLFYNVEDFTKKVALVPCSAETKEGLPEIVMVLCGLSQKYLKGKLELNQKAQGVIFEINKEKSINYIEAILHDGQLKRGDEIAIATFEKPFVSKIRVLEEVMPLSSKIRPIKDASAATGIRLQLTKTEDILPGMPFQIFENNLEELEKQFKKEIEKAVETDNQGIIIKADSLGSLEALQTLLKQNNIQVVKSGIGHINKSDIASAKMSGEKNPLNACILGFNVKIDNDAKEVLSKKEIKVFTEDVVYKLIENLGEWREKKKKEIEREKLSKLSSIFKLNILRDFVFRNSSPAIFGVEIVAGKLTQKSEVIDQKGEKIGEIKSIQKENENVQEAEKGDEIAASVPGVTFDRQLKDSTILYSNVSEREYRQFKDNKDLLTEDEKSILKEIANIKRQKNPVWGI